MSGAKEVLEFELRLHGATVSDPKLEAGLAAITQGISSSHSGAIIRFSNYDLFKQYIQNSGIPYSTSQRDGVTVYEVNVNFGPDGKVGIGDSKSVLYTELEACLSTMLLTQVTLSDKGRAILDDQREVASPLSPLSWFTRKTINLDATTIIHQHLMDHRFYEQINGRNEKEKLFIASIALRKFASDLEVAEKKYIENSNRKDAGKIFMDNVNNSLDLLKKTLDPDNKMSRAEFVGEVDEFITIGTPPTQNIVIPLVHEGSGQRGANLEGMLKFLEEKQQEIKAGKLTYNLLLFNCSHFLREMVKASIQGDPKLKSAFETNLISEEKMLGIVANFVSPHGGLTERLNPNDVCTPVIIASMLTNFREQLEQKVEEQEKAGPTRKRFRDDSQLPTRKIQRLDSTYDVENDAPNISRASLTPQYSASLKVKPVGDENQNLDNIAKNIIEKLDGQAKADPSDAGLMITDLNNKPIAAVEKADGQIVIRFYDLQKEGLTTTSLANVIDSHFNAGNRETITFDVISTDKSQTKEIVQAIQQVYAKTDHPFSILVNGQQPSSQGASFGA